MSARIRRRGAPSSVVPTATSNVPCGVRTNTIAPGTFIFFTAASTIARSSCGSMTFNAEFFGVELPGVVVAEDAVDFSPVGEQPAINTASTAMHTRCTVRESMTTPEE